VTDDQGICYQPDGTAKVTHHVKLTLKSGEQLDEIFEGVGVPILAEVNGVQQPVGLRFRGKTTYTGGTGRFSGAKGVGFSAGEALFDPPVAPDAPPVTGAGFVREVGIIVPWSCPGPQAPERFRAVRFCKVLPYAVPL